ncbi:MAG: DNA internalization-related competence protein ComEC/Rec2 [Lachnospiraceae bacterium]|nr:DNA internalization-related competence protein ComEC/Rec2 [Lachnospiraceae bacterium]
MAEKRPVLFVMPALILGEVDAMLGMHCILFVLCISYILVQKITVKKKTIFFAVIFLLFFCGSINYKNELSRIDKISGLQGEVSAEGIFSREEETDSGVRYYLKNVIISNKVRVKQLIVYSDRPSYYKPGNKILVKGTLKNFEESANYGNQDMRFYYKTLGVYCYLRENYSECKKGRSNVVKEILFDFREKIIITIRNIRPECKEKYVITAMITGYKGDLDDEIKNDYMLGGISHIIAISGLHITAIGIAVFKLLRLRFRFVLSGFASFGVVIAFVVMTGEQVSAERAMVMFAFYLLANALGRKYDMANAIAFAVIVMCIFNPFIIMNFSFQMSVGAVGAIVWILPLLSEFMGVDGMKYYAPSKIKKKKRIEDKMICVICDVKVICCKGLVAGLAINFVTMPILIFNYYQISRFSLIINVMVVPCMTLILMMSFGGLIAGMIPLIPKQAGNVLLAPVTKLLRLFSKICRGATVIPGNVFVTGKPDEYQIVIYYMIIFVVFIGISRFNRLKKEESKASRDEEKRVNRRWKWIGVVFAYLILPYLLCHGKEKDEIILNNVGQGDCILVLDKAANIMIDCGSSDVDNLYKYRIKSALNARRITKLDYVFLTHGDDDHISGVCEMLDDKMPDSIKVDKIVLPKTLDKNGKIGQVLKQIDESKVMYFKSGDTLKSSSLSVTCLHPSPDFQSEEENNHSLVLDIKQNEKRYLFTGDIPMECEELFLDKLHNKYDVLKVAHHGSKNSTSMEILERIRANVYLISCGDRNRYGHPHKELIDRLEAAGGRIIVTSVDGQVVVK